MIFISIVSPVRHHSITQPRPAPHTNEWIVYAMYCPVFTTGVQPVSRVAERGPRHVLWLLGWRIDRHNQLRDHLFNTCMNVALGPANEQRALIPGSDVRPADARATLQGCHPPHYACYFRYDEKINKQGEPIRLADMVARQTLLQTLMESSEQHQPQQQQQQ